MEPWQGVWNPGLDTSKMGVTCKGALLGVQQKTYTNAALWIARISWGLGQKHPAYVFGVVYTCAAGLQTALT